MLKLGGFGPRQKPRKYGYTPRTYDPDAEKRRERLKILMGEEYVEGEKEYKPGVLIREGRMRRMQEKSNQIHRRSKTTLIRTAIFVILVFAILWLITNFFTELGI